MTIDSEKAAKLVCELTNWKTTNLSIHKILYIAHMTALGRSKGQRPLLDESFEAWDYGPVLPDVYKKLKIFGRKPVKNVFFEDTADISGFYREIIEETVGALGDLRAGKLVAITHWQKGAWNKNYIVGKRGIKIKNKDIYDEYCERTK